MKTTLRNKIIWLIISILVSVSLPAGILMIILGFAIKGMGWVAITGIVLAVHGFYGITFYWMQFAKVSKYHRVVRVIERLHLTNAAEISEATHLGRDFVNRTIRLAIEREWITGCKFNGTSLIPAEDVKKKAPTEQTCEYCGAKFFNNTEGAFKCPNCGALLNNKNNNQPNKQED